MFKSPFSFKGRIRRSEYLLSIIIGIGVNAIIQIATLYIMGASFQAGTYELEDGPAFVMFILMLPSFWFMLANAVKRSHDLGNSGWWILIPFYGFWLLFADSKHGYNEYGDNPKGFGPRRNEFEFEGGGAQP